MLLLQQQKILDEYISNGGKSYFYKHLPIKIIMAMVRIEDQDNLKSLVDKYLQKNQIPPW
jgi:hypothetical protein